VVILKNGDGEQSARTTEKDLIDYCRDRIASYKRPREVIFISADEMPRTATGKILHRRLREELKSSTLRPSG
jgi:acyl-CoA synthetase (AMP-forming)/AMP-acid ligase II